MVNFKLLRSEWHTTACSNVVFSCLWCPMLVQLDFNNICCMVSSYLTHSIYAVVQSIWTWLKTYILTQSNLGRRWFLTNIFVNLVIVGKRACNLTYHSSPFIISKSHHLNSLKLTKMIFVSLNPFRSVGS